MKIRDRISTLALLAMIALSSCSEDEAEVIPRTPLASFTMTPRADNPNYIALQNTSLGDDMLAGWRFREGQALRRATGADTAYYVEAGTYTITLVVGNETGIDSISKEVVIEQRDPDLPDPDEGAFLLLGDFEEGGVGDAAIWNQFSQVLSVVENPAPNSVNDSERVLLLAQTQPFETNAAYTQAPVVNDLAIKVEVDAYFEVAGRLKFQMEEPFETGYFLDVPAGEWVTLTYELENEVDSETPYPRFLIQGDTPGNYYLDNIKYFGLDVVVVDDGTTDLGDFEDEDPSMWDSWGQGHSVVDNPGQDAVNSSDKVLELSQAEGWAASAVRDEAIVTANATRMTFDVYMTAPGSVKLQIEESFDTGQFIDIGEDQINQWVTLEYDLTSAVSPDGAYPWLIIQSGAAGTYYIDNLTYYEE